MLCKIGTFDPFNCKYRLIGNASYKTCPLSKFVDSVSQELLHWFKDWEPEYDTTELSE